MMEKTVFKSTCTREIFAFYKEAFPKRKGALSLRQFATLLNYQSPRTVGMIIQGQRFATKTILQRLIEKAKLGEAEKQFCELVWAHEDLTRRDPDSQKIRYYEDKIARFRKEGFAWRDLDKEKLKVLLDWHYAVLLAGIDSPFFPQLPEEISALLGHRVSPITVRESLAVLEKLEMIQINPQSMRWQTTNLGFITPFDVPNLRIRESHVKILRDAERAITKYPVEEREFIHVAFPAPMEKMPEIKKKIRDFIFKTTHAFWNSETTLVHRLGIYLYPETNPDSAKMIADKEKGR